MQLWWGTRYEAPHSVRHSVLSTLASRNSHCTLSTVEQRHASCGQTCDSTVVLAGRGGGAGTQLRGRTLGHVARAWRLASLACLARVCRRAVRARVAGRRAADIAAKIIQIVRGRRAPAASAPAGGPGRGSVIFPLRACAGPRDRVCSRFGVRQFLYLELTRTST